MTTELQRRFCKSRMLRRAMLDYLGAEGFLTGDGFRRMWNTVIHDAFGNMPEAQIKLILFSFLRCADITPEERTETLRLLKLSGTALTKNQRRQLTFLLSE